MRGKRTDEYGGVSVIPKYTFHATGDDCKLLIFPNYMEVEACKK